MTARSNDPEGGDASPQRCPTQTRRRRRCLTDVLSPDPGRVRAPTAATWRSNTATKGAHPMQLIPLAVLAAEIGQPVEQLAEHLGEAVHTDSASGVRMVPAHICCQLITAHTKALQAQAQAQAAQAETQAAQQEQQAAQYAAEARARQAREQRQRELLAESPELSAVELMLAMDRDPAANTPAGRMFDELFNAQREGVVGHMYKFTPTNE